MFTFKLPLVFFALASVLGLLLRLHQVVPVTMLKYDNFVHAHSHTAMLGWLYTIIVYYSIKLFKADSPAMRKTFNASVFLSGLMLPAFAIQGYASISIVLSSLHIMVSYIIVFKLYNKAVNDKTISSLYLKGGGIFYLLSTLAPWALAVISASGLKQTEIYFQIIYFYLHFLYNGFFTFAVIGFIFFQLKIEARAAKTLQKSFFILFFSTLGTLFLSYTQYSLSAVLIAFTAVSCAAQLYAISLLIKVRDEIFNTLRNKNYNFLLYISFMCFVLKIIFQAVSLHPVFYGSVFYSRDLIIAFMHLVMLGFCSFYMIFYIINNEGFKKTKLLSSAVYAITSGFVITEAFLFFNGSRLMLGWYVIPYYHGYLLLAAFMLMSGMLILLATAIKKPERN